MTSGRPKRTRRLPIVFRALDVGAKTKPVPSLTCPLRGALMTVGNCGRCTHFRSIEFAENGTPMLACAPESAQPAASKALIQRLLQVPSLCVAQDTPIAEILPFIGRCSGTGAIPVLDRAARPVGLVERSRLREWVAHGRSLSTPVASLMRTLLLRALPETCLADARARAAFSDCSDCVVVGTDGTFLGLVSKPELAE